MVSSKQVPLSEAYWFQEGPGVRNWQFTTSGVKLLNVGNITKDGNIDLDKTDKHISLDEAEGKYHHFLVDEGDLVIASSGISFDDDGMLRTRGAFIEKKHLPLCLNTSTIRFKAIDGVSDLNFFKFWLDSFEFRNQVSRLVTGSAQQNFGPSHLKAIGISLPPLTEQKRIASLLARADRLRSLRRTARDLGESLLQSVFLEMFGDVVRNDKGWDRVELAELVRKDDTINYGVVQPGDDFPNGKPIIRVGDLDNLAQNLATLKLIDPKIEANYKRSRIVGDEILIACVGSIGRVALVNEKMKGFNIVRAVARVPANYEFVNRLYLATYLSTPFVQDFFLKETRTVSQPTLNITQIEETPVFVPPLSLQEEFAGVVARVEGLRGRMSESERQAEGLFESLLSQSFA